jgi:hypothetical protein
MARRKRETAEIPSLLTEAVKNKRAILFLGAGAPGHRGRQGALTGRHRQMQNSFVTFSLIASLEGP